MTWIENCHLVMTKGSIVIARLRSTTSVIASLCNRRGNPSITLSVTLPDSWMPHCGSPRSLPLPRDDGRKYRHCKLMYKMFLLPVNSLPFNGASYAWNLLSFEFTCFCNFRHGNKQLPFCIRRYIHFS